MIPKKEVEKNYTYLLSGILEYEDGTRFSGDSGKGNQYRYYRNKTNEISTQREDIDIIIFDRLRAYLTDNNVYGDLLKKAIQIKNQSLPEKQNDPPDGPAWRRRTPPLQARCRTRRGSRHR